MIIDHIDRLELPDSEAKKYHNELRSLDYLAKGLKFLYVQVQKVKAEVAKRVGKNEQVFIFGNAPQLKVIPQDLVACAFHWYAVTVCNYVKIVGWLANSGDPTEAKKYMKLVLPQVYLWRHKVGAHFARHSPKGDTPADLAMSTGGKSSTSRRDMRWSLTYTHSNLIPRY